MQVLPEPVGALTTMLSRLLYATLNVGDCTALKYLGIEVAKVWGHCPDINRAPKVKQWLKTGRQIAGHASQHRTGAVAHVCYDVLGLHVYEVR